MDEVVLGMAVSLHANGLFAIDLGHKRPVSIRLPNSPRKFGITIDNGHRPITFWPAPSSVKLIGTCFNRASLPTQVSPFGSLLFKRVPESGFDYCPSTGELSARKGPTSSCVAQMTLLLRTLKTGLVVIRTT